MFDLDKRLWRCRDMLHDPVDFDAMRFSSPQEQAAGKLILNDLVKVESRDSYAAKGTVTDDGRTYQVQITLDEDEWLTDADCRFFRHRTKGLRKGTCTGSVEIDEL